VQEHPSRLSVADVQTILEHGDPVTFVDSRNPIAWASSKVKIRSTHRAAPARAHSCARR
jgi:hypothetical protein